METSDLTAFDMYVVDYTTGNQKVNPMLLLKTKVLVHKH